MTEQEEKEPTELRPTSAEELKRRATRLEELPSGLVVRIRKINNFMLAQLPLPEEAVRIARETGDPRKAEEALSTTDAVLLMQQLIHVGIVEPHLAMPLSTQEILALAKEGKDQTATVDDLDNRDFMAVYKAICVFGGLEPLQMSPFPESESDTDSRSDGAEVAGGRDTDGVSEVAPPGVDGSAADPDGGAD